MQFGSSLWRVLPRSTTAVLFAAIALMAQTYPVKRTNAAPRSAEMTKLKLTPLQKQGLRLLQAAEKDLPALHPDMRSFVLWQVSHGYLSIRPTKVNSLLNRAFLTTLAIEGSKAPVYDCSKDEFCNTKQWLQTNILREMIERSNGLGRIEALVRRAEPDVQRALSKDLLQAYIKKNEFGLAREVLNRFPEEDFPYDGATTLIMALPAGQDQDRLAIFSQAMNSFSQDAGELKPRVNDLSIMVVRVWRELPAPVILEAIDQILSRAEEADKDLRNVRIGVSTYDATADFTSHYQFRLFQLMPVLEELDQSRAQDLLRENGEARAALERYPRGLGSMGPAPSQRNPKGESEMPDILSVDVSDSNNWPESTAEQIHSEIIRRQTLIFREVERNLQQALSDTMTLPTSDPVSGDHPRALTLLEVAHVVARQDPTTCMRAIQELRALRDSVALPEELDISARLPQIYLLAGDEDGAREALEESLKKAEKIYLHDSDLNDPNRAFKGMWPSANLWWRCLQFAAEFAPEKAEEIVDNIPDPEIATFERVSLAISLLGERVGLFSVREMHQSK